MFFWQKNPFYPHSQLLDNVTTSWRLALSWLLAAPPFLGLPLGLSQNVLDLWVVLETEQSRVSWGLLLCPPPSNPSPRPRPIPHSQSPQVIWSRRSRHSAKLSLSSPGSPHETQVWPAQCDQSDQDILSCFLWKHTPGTFLPALTSATRSQVFPFRPGFL